MRINTMTSRNVCMAVCAVAAMVLPACVAPHTNLTQVQLDPEVVQSSTRFRKEYVLAPGIKSRSPYDAFPRYPGR